MKRYMLMFKSDQPPEPGKSPCKAELPEMARLMGELNEKGVLVYTDGLMPSDSGARVRVVRVNSKAEAVELAKQFLTIAGGGTSDVLEVWEHSGADH